MKRISHQTIFYIFLALIPVQLGLHFWPSWAMVLGRRVDYLSPTLHLTDILLILLFGAFVYQRKKTHAFGTGKFLKTVKKIIRSPLFSIGSFLVCCNILFSKNPFSSLYQLLKGIEFVFLALYIIKTKPELKKIVLSFSVAIIISSCIAISQFVLQRSVGGAMFFLGERMFYADTPGIAKIELCSPLVNSCRLFLRSYGTFPHPNVLGGFLAVILIWMGLFYEKERKRIQKNVRILLVSSFVLGIPALIVTFSRSAIFAFLFGGIAILYFALKRGDNTCFKQYKIAIPVILFIVLVAGAGSVLKQSLGTESSLVRNQLNTAALLMFLHNFPFGVGWGAFLSALPSYMSTRTIYFLQPVHNIYLLIVSQLGLTGVLFLSFLFAKLLMRVKKGFSVSIIPVVMIFSLGFVDHYFLTLQQGQILLSVTAGLYINSAIKK